MLNKIYKHRYKDKFHHRPRTPKYHYLNNLRRHLQETIKLSRHKYPALVLPRLRANLAMLKLLVKQTHNQSFRIIKEMLKLLPLV